MNRTQLIIGKEKCSSLDEALLQILSPVVWNYQNLVKSNMEISIEDLFDEGN